MQVDIVFEITDAGSAGVVGLTNLAIALLNEKYFQNLAILTPQQTLELAQEVEDRGLNYIVR